MKQHIDTVVSQLKDYLLEKKTLRSSEEREMILRHIDLIDGHFSINGLVEIINRDRYVSRATVYNAVNLFVKANLVVRHPFYDSDEQYEATWRAPHHHRICTNCGAVKEFSDKKIQTPINNRSFNAFDKQYSCVYLYGLCKKCQKKKKIQK